MDPTVTTSSGQLELNRVLDYSPQLMTEATGRAILAQLMVLQEQQADLAAAVHLLVESGKRSGLVMTQGHSVGGR